MAYSMDLRTRVLADYDRGMRTGEVAQKFSVSPAWVRWLKQRRRETGSIEPRKPPGRPCDMVKHREALQASADEYPDQTLEERRQSLGLECSLTTIWRELRRLGFRYK